MRYSFGSQIRFTITEDLGIQNFGDMDFRLARIRLSNGVLTFASFENHQFAHLRSRTEEIRAAVCHQVFSLPETGKREFGIQSFGAPSLAPVLMLTMHPRHLTMTDLHREAAMASYEDMTCPAALRPLRAVRRAYAISCNFLRPS